MREVAEFASTVVAVVGAGHLSGITQNWESEIDIEEVSNVCL